MKQRLRFRLLLSKLSVFRDIIYRLVLSLIMLSAMLGCEQAEQVVRNIISDEITEPTIKIGLILPLERRIHTKYGAQLALAEINQQGGILGHSIQLIVKDDQGNPQRGEQVAEELITKNGVIAILGSNFSSVSLKAAPIAQRFGVPMITTTATNPTITQVGDFVFQTAFTDDFQGVVIAQFAIESLRVEAVAILTQADDVYSEGLSQIFEENFIASGGTIVAREVYAAGDTDFTAQLEAIAAQTPDAVFMPGFAREVAPAVKQARAIPVMNTNGATSPFLGGDGMG